MFTINIPATHTGYMATFNIDINGNPDCQSGDYSEGTSIRRATLKFGNLGNGTIPKGIIVCSATMYLLANGSGAAYSRYRYLYRTTVELGTYATWRTWGGLPNVQYLGTSSERWPAYTGAVWRTIPMNKEIVASMIKGLTPNYGFIITAEGEYNDLYGINYGSSLPYIQIKYIKPSGQPVFLNDYGTI